MEDSSDEKLDPGNDVTYGEESDANYGDIGDMPNLRTMLRHFQGEDRLSKEYKEFQTLLDDSKEQLYPNCKKGHSKLASTLELLRFKSRKRIVKQKLHEDVMYFQRHSSRW
jgi:hypothetical protein